MKTSEYKKGALNHQYEWNLCKMIGYIITNMLRLYWSVKDDKELDLNQDHRPPLRWFCVVDSNSILKYFKHFNSASWQLELSNIAEKALTVSNSGWGPIFVVEIRGWTDQLNINEINFLSIYWDFNIFFVAQSFTMISEINLQLNFFQAMIWFDKLH